MAMLTSSANASPCSPPEISTCASTWQKYHVASQCGSGPADQPQWCGRNDDVSPTLHMNNCMGQNWAGHQVPRSRCSWSKPCSARWASSRPDLLFLQG